jgi:hypothetical protein
MVMSLVGNERRHKGVMGYHMQLHLFKSHIEASRVDGIKTKVGPLIAGERSEVVLMRES